MSAFLFILHKTMTGILSVFYFSRCNLKRLSQESKPSETQCTYTFYYMLWHQNRGCVYCTYSVTTKSIRGCGGECIKMVERVLTALNQDALSGPHIAVDVDCQHVAVCLHLSQSGFHRCLAAARYLQSKKPFKSGLCTFQCRISVN